MITFSPPFDDPLPDPGPGGPGVPGDERPFTDPTLLAYRDRIAALREIKCHVTAGIMRDELLNQLECWLDPTGAAHTRALQAEQGRQAAHLATMIDPTCGF